MIPEHALMLAGKDALAYMSHPSRIAQTGPERELMQRALANMEKRWGEPGEPRTVERLARPRVVVVV